MPSASYHFIQSSPEKELPVKKLLYLLVLGAVILAACGGDSGSVAATVDGQDVTVSDVEALIDSEGETVPIENFAQFLGLQIQWNVVEEAAEAEYDIIASDDEVSAETDRLFEQFAVEGQTREDFLSASGVTEEFLTQVARQELLSAQLLDVFADELPEPTDEEVEAQLNVAKAPLTEACVSHILVASEDEANDVFTRLDAGEEFAALAEELSSDTGSAANGGELPCSTLDTYVEEFRDAALVAPVGEVHVTAVESQFGWHIILVTERTDADEADLPTDEELFDSARDANASGDLGSWIAEAIAAAEVSVEEEYGTWDPTQGTVVPPVS